MTTGSLLEAPPAEALELSESVSLALEETSWLSEGRFTPEPGSVFDAQGRVPVVVIRPGIGRGRGRHLYEAEMLRENAQKFTGWRMYIDHLSPDARKAAGGLPRSVRDLGGRLVETWWEENVPAVPGRHPAGAVVGLAKPVPFIRELVENDPEIIEASISASATGVRPVVREGQRVWLVEGIDDHGSLDWVTEAGAGGRIIPLLEAAYTSEEAVRDVLLETLSDDEIREQFESRPHLAEAMAQKKAGDGDSDGEDGGGEFEKKCRELEKKGMPRKMAEKVARRQLSESSHPEGGDDVATNITPEALQEALSASPEVLTQALAESAEVQLFVNGLVEAKLEEERTVIEAQAEARAQRQIDLRDLREEAHSLISEARLPETWQASLRKEFTLVEGKPTTALDVLDEVDEEGKVTKSAAEKLRESVEARIAEERQRLAEAAPTRVRGQKPRAADEDGEDKPKSAKGTGWGRFLQESAGIDPDKAYGLEGAGDPA